MHFIEETGRRSSPEITGCLHTSKRMHFIEDPEKSYTINLSA